MLYPYSDTSTSLRALRVNTAAAGLVTCLQRKWLKRSLKDRGTALGLSLFHFNSPIDRAMAESGSKHSSGKCFSHSTLCLEGPLHRWRIFFTCFVHFSPKIGSLGNFEYWCSNTRLQCNTSPSSRKLSITVLGSYEAVPSLTSRVIPAHTGRI